ncbi:MAG TPA: L,D-transpeptidase, partial [Dehalococcoidia bacterium]|nr:L,D-transpeptidase [Dehalococcoidia bacterium]
MNLTDQTATLMAGETPVWTALVTSGREGWETPTGTFYIGLRVENETMTSESLGISPEDEFYHLEDVLFTQYFTNEGHALHLNYWQPEYVFGNTPTSHGCIGMFYDDALYFWQALDIGSRV